MVAGASAGFGNGGAAKAVVAGSIGKRRDLVVVAQSFGGYTAPLVCARRPADLLVLVAGMVPSRGESAQEMLFENGAR